MTRPTTFYSPSPVVAGGFSFGLTLRPKRHPSSSDHLGHRRRAGAGGRTWSASCPVAGRKSAQRLLDHRHRAGDVGRLRVHLASLSPPSLLGTSQAVAAAVPEMTVVLGCTISPSRRNHPRRPANPHRLQGNRQPKWAGSRAGSGGHQEARQGAGCVGGGLGAFGQDPEGDGGGGGIAPDETGFPETSVIFYGCFSGVLDGGGGVRTKVQASLPRAGLFCLVSRRHRLASPAPR